MGGCYTDNTVMSQLDVAIECPDETANCLADATGEDTCGDIAACTDMCQDEQCQTDCFEAGTADGQSEYIALIYCIGHYCPMWQGQCVNQVIMNQCMAFFGACFN
jgi:hypothetical protein